MAKLKDHIIKEEEHRRHVQQQLTSLLKTERERNHLINKFRHDAEPRWAEDMPDLEGKALADAEKQFDYDSWLGEHGIGD